MSSIGKTKARGTYHEWQTDELATAANNSNIEGDDTSFSTPTATTRVGNYCQISKKSVVVAGTLDAVNKAGRKQEIGYQIQKASKELARDMEFALLQNASSNAGATGTARQLKGVTGFISTNQTDNGGTTALSQAILETAIQNAWTQGGTPDCILANPTAKGTISDMVTGVTKFRDETDKKIVNTVSVFESDFGTLEVKASRHNISDEVYVIQKDLWKLAQLRPVKVEDLAKTGDAEKKQIVTEYTLVSLQEKGNASIINIA